MKISSAFIQTTLSKKQRYQKSHCVSYTCICKKSEVSKYNRISEVWNNLNIYNRISEQHKNKRTSYAGNNIKQQR